MKMNTGMDCGRICTLNRTLVEPPRARKHRSGKGMLWLDRGQVPYLSDEHLFDCLLQSAN
jgi:hypothetical protein